MNIRLLTHTLIADTLAAVTMVAPANAVADHKPISRELMQLLDANPDIQNMLESSLAETNQL